jgi:hypothetical protein
MKTTLIAVLLSAFVWPGAGQIYNREFWKGVVLVCLTILFALSFLIGAGAEIAHRIPAGTTQLSVDQARAITEEILNQRSGYILAFNLLVMAVWLYGVVDAYLGARERLQRLAAPPAPPPEPPADDAP